MGPFPFSALDIALPTSVSVSVFAIALFWIVRRLPGKHDDVEEFLVAGRSIHFTLVGASLLGTLICTTAFLQYPWSAYAYGTRVVNTFGLVMLLPAWAHVFMPVLYNLHVLTVYEYLELRFNYTIRAMLAVAYVIQRCVHLTLTAHALVITLDVLQFPFKLSALVMVFLCAMYTVFGGIRAIIWSDLFCLCIMLLGFLALLVGGSTAGGGIGTVWQAAETGERINFFRLEPSPLVKYTLWTQTFGFLLKDLLHCFHQSQVQRVVACRTLRHAKIAIYIAEIGFMVVSLFGVMTGLAVYARYQHCDPKQAHSITLNDELIPYFVNDALSNAQGVRGLFVAAVGSATLLITASNVMSVATVITIDLVQPHWINVDTTLIIRSICIGMVFVIFIFTLIYNNVAMIKDEGLLRIWSRGPSMVLMPSISVFVMGIFLPWVNWKGAASGFVISLMLMTWLKFGNLFLTSEPSGQLPMNIAGCAGVSENFTHNLTDRIGGQSNLYDLNVFWMSLVGLCSCIVVAVAASAITGFNKPDELDPGLYILPWKRERGGSEYSESDAPTIPDAHRFREQQRVSWMPGP